ncbi:MAG: SURF1 family protein [Pseudomonadota bacterium]|nr:hypothetical protein [Pseudomonadales bacterium]MDY6921538.1 SURF1 family protein [Pseudomonadota bacterium]
MSNSVPQSRRHGVQVGPYRFAPGVIPSLVTLVLLVLLINLGLWQLRRAEAKEYMVERLAQRSEQASRSLAALSPQDLQGDLTDYPLHARGRYLNQYQFLLDNRTYQMEPGYQILTPFLTNGNILLVNRGWIPQGPDRSVFPELPLQQGDLTLYGHAHQPSPDIFVLKEDNYQDVSWPFLIQKIDLEKTRQLFDYPVLPFVLRLNPDPSSPLVREWHSRFMGPEKHYGYAVQWFSLATALMVIYFVVNTKKTKRSE